MYKVCLRSVQLVLQTETQKSHFSVRPWSLLTILNFSKQGPTDTKGRQTRSNRHVANNSYISDKVMFFKECPRFWLNKIYLRIAPQKDVPILPERYLSMMFQWNSGILYSRKLSHYVHSIKENITVCTVVSWTVR